MLHIEKKDKINYVMACWSGERRFQDIRRIQNPAFYLQQHIAALNKYNHQLNQITLAVAYNPEESPIYQECLSTLPEYIQNAKVVIIRRHNLGLSYGALADVYAQFKDDFDYYMFNEDDFYFAQPNFDIIHIIKMKKDPRVGYVCACADRVNYITGYKNGKPTLSNHFYARQSNGCFCTKALKALAKDNGGVIYPVPYTEIMEEITTEKIKNKLAYVQPSVKGQVNISRKLLKLGYKVVDLRKHYDAGLRNADGRVDWFFNKPKRMSTPI